MTIVYYHNVSPVWRVRAAVKVLQFPADTDPMHGRHQVTLRTESQQWIWRFSNQTTKWKVGISDKSKSFKRNHKLMSQTFQPFHSENGVFLVVNLPKMLESWPEFPYWLIVNWLPYCIGSSHKDCNGNGKFGKRSRVLNCKSHRQPNMQSST